MKRVYVISAGVVGVVLLLVAICLYFPGYRQRVEWNGDLVEGVCTVASHSIEKGRCSYQCRCKEICRTDPDFGRQCHDECDTCWRDCYKGYFMSNYTVSGVAGDEVVMSYSTRLTTNTDRGAVDRKLKADKPIGSQYLCYYHGMDPSEVVLSKYNENGYFVAAIIFFVLTCLACGGACFGGLSMYGPVIQQWINDFREPTYTEKGSSDAGMGGATMSSFRGGSDSSSSSSSSSS